MGKMSYRQAFVVCPFYQGDWKTSVSCEGVVDGSFIRQVFSSKSGIDLHMNVFCNANYKNCEIYRMLMESKYKEE